MKTLLLLAPLFSTCFAQGALTLAPPSNPRAGSTAIWTVTLSGNTSPAALQWTFGCDHTIGTVVAAAAGTAAAAQKSTSIAATGTLIVAGLNATPIADGLIATITVGLPAALSNVNLTCTIQGGILPALGSSGTATAIVETPNPPASVLILPSLSLCDVNQDGQTNATDVTLERTAVQNQTAADRNGDGLTNILDLQIVTNAALGQACAATQ